MGQKEECVTHSADSPPLTIDVALTPAAARPHEAPHAGTVYIVVDVIRATTSLCVLFERGCSRVLAVRDVPAARALQARLGEAYALAGETGGLAPVGFSAGNSPAELAALDLTGRAIIFATTNGTRAMLACAGGRAILAGSLRNATAVAKAAIAAVPIDYTEDEQPADSLNEHESSDIVIVCAGRGDRPAYDDTLCAGVLARHIQREAERLGRRVVPRDGGLIAAGVAGQAREHGGLAAALGRSAAARAIQSAGLGADIAWCADVDATTLVPRVVREDVAAPFLVVEA